MSCVITGCPRRLKPQTCGECLHKAEAEARREGYQQALKDVREALRENDDLTAYFRLKKLRELIDRLEKATAEQQRPQG